MKKVAVIGSGIGGMASAIRMANLGYEVDVFEANTYPGGKLTELRSNGYRFDAGPSLFTLPELLDKLFRECGEDPADYYQYNKVDIITKYFYPDGKKVNAYSDVSEFAKELEEKLGEPARNVRKHLEKAEVQYESTKDIFLFNSMHKAETYLKNTSLKVMIGLGQLDAMRSMHSANKSRFKTAAAAQFFDRYATYNGSDPYQAPATLNLIAHLEHNVGAYFMHGGMHKVTESLKALADKKGVRFHFEEKVERICLENEEANGVKTETGEYPADMVVSNMDVSFTYRRLMPGAQHPDKILNQPKSTSALIFYWGMKKQFPELDLHNIFFTGDYKSEFNYLRKGEVYSDPTVYTYISSKLHPEDAPAGHENWFVMINVPNDSGQDWDKIIAKARENIIRKLNGILHTNIEAFIDEQDILEPRLIEQKTSSEGGALYGNSSNNMFAAFMRHPNFSKKIRNLYFCGGSVHPGGGIPLCLASAQIIEGLVRNDL